MNKAYRELFLNTTVVSLIISIIFAGVAASLVRWDPFVFSWGFDFLLIFLVIYFYNLAVSVLSFALAKLCRPVTLRLLLFNISGLLLTALIVCKLDAFYLISIYSTFIILSLTSLFCQKTAGNT